MIAVKSSQPVDNPVGLTEMKLHLRVTGTTEDELIKAQTEAATEWCETYEGQSYMVRNYAAYMDCFPSNMFYLPNSPVISITSIQYYDTSDTLQTVSTSTYTLDKDSMPARVYLNFGYNWPTTYSKNKAVIVNYVAGYATTFTAAATDVITLGNAIFSDLDAVRVGTDSGDLPAPLSTATTYYVRDISGSTIKLSTATTGTTRVDITDVGSGTHYIGLDSKGLVPARVKSAIKLITADMYENRQTLVIGTINSVLDWTAKNLLTERMFI